jgi:hypothetical protein
VCKKGGGGILAAKWLSTCVGIGESVCCLCQACRGEREDEGGDLVGGSVSAMRPYFAVMKCMGEHARMLRLHMR